MKYAVLVITLFCSLVGVGQTLIYDNGIDTGTLGRFPISDVNTVSDSFVIEQPTTVDHAIVYIEDVNDRNLPLYLDWEITTEPFGGEVLGSGNVVRLVYLGSYYPLWCIWKMGLPLGVHLEPGTYYLQLNHTLTRWKTWAFWGVSNGPSTADARPCTTQPCPPSVPSEAFQLYGRAD